MESILLHCISCEDCRRLGLKGILEMVPHRSSLYRRRDCRGGHAAPPTVNVAKLDTEIDVLRLF